MDKETAQALQALYLKGIELFTNMDTDVSAPRRVRELREAIAGWNRCQRILDGKCAT